MKKQDIRTAYTQKVAELLAQGYTIFPDTMGGHQGEIAKVDLTNGPEILRVLLEREYCRHSHGEDTYWGETITLTVGRAGEDTWLGANFDGTIWNQRLETLFQIEWAEISGRRNGDWYTDLDEGRRIQKLQIARSKAQSEYRRTPLDGAWKAVALRWLRKQPRMKTCRLEDIEKMERVWDPEKQKPLSYEIRAKGHSYTIR